MEHEEKKMKKMDKVLSGIILTMGILTASVLFYFVLWVITSLMNSSEFSKVLIDLKIYRLFYPIANTINSGVVLLLITVFFLAIPYLIVSIILGIFVLIRYVKFKGEKKKQIAKMVLLSIMVAFFVLKGISSLPLTTQYEIPVKEKVEKITNLEVKEFLKKELERNWYVDKIVIVQGFPDDYVVRIYYRDPTKKVAHTSLLDSDYYFIQNNAKDVTYLLEIQSILFTLLGDILYIYLVIYVRKELKRIS